MNNVRKTKIARLCEPVPKIFDQNLRRAHGHEVHRLARSFFNLINDADCRLNLATPRIQCDSSFLQYKPGEIILRKCRGSAPYESVIHDPQVAEPIQHFASKIALEKTRAVTPIYHFDRRW